jgi:hypothetical protein
MGLESMRKTDVKLLWTAGRSGNSWELGKSHLSEEVARALRFDERVPRSQ